jgi:outer membrane protein assembly factor BamB
VQDGYVYVLGATGDLVCFTDKGEEKWHKNLVADFGGGIPNWGYSESVLIDGDNLICTPGGKGGIIALNKATGATVWQCKDVTDGAGYSSIMIATIGGVKQYVQQTMAHGVGVRAKDGKKLWEIGEIKRKIAVIPSPVLKGDIVFFTAGYGAGCEGYKLEADGKDGTKATKLYSNSNITNHHGGAIGFGKYVFGHSDANSEWNCLDIESGEIVWKNKIVGKGSVSAADGYFYCYGEGTGNLTRAKITEKGFEEAGKFTIPKTSTLRPKQGKVWAHPVIANGKLFLREYDLLFVYDLLGPRS